MIKRVVIQMLSWLLLATVVFSCLGQPLCMGQTWTRFRGPNGSGVSNTVVPTTWTEDQINWKIELPGSGHSSPVGWGQSVFLMSADEKNATQFVIAIDAKSGKPIWQREFASEAYHIHARSSFASTTPAVDSEHVYVAWSTPEKTTVAALGHDGNVQWKRTLDRPFDSQHGFGASPILVGDRVILCVMQKKPQRNGPRVQKSHVVAFDRATGEVDWDTLLWSDAVSYSAPCIRESATGEQEIISCSTAHGIFSLNPNDGTENWSIDVFDKRTVSSPILVGDLILGSTGSGGGGNYVAAVRPGAKPELAYEIRKQAPYVPTPVCKGDLVFLWSDKGIVTCIRGKDGTQVWQERVGGNFSGSPIIAGEHVYCIDEDGVVNVVSASDKFELVGKTPLGEASRSTPSVIDGQLLLRTYGHLISVGG